MTYRFWFLIWKEFTLKPIIFRLFEIFSTFITESMCWTTLASTFDMFCFEVNNKVVDLPVLFVTSYTLACTLWAVLIFFVIIAMVFSFEYSFAQSACEWHYEKFKAQELFVLQFQRIPFKEKKFQTWEMNVHSITIFGRFLFFL